MLHDIADIDAILTRFDQIQLQLHSSIIAAFTLRSIVIAQLLSVCRAALADLEGIMPEFDASGDREHSGWNTIKDLKDVISKLETSLTNKKEAESSISSPP